MIRAHFDTKQIDRGLGGLYTYGWRQRKSGERKEFVPRERSTVKNKEGGGMGGGGILSPFPRLLPPQSTVAPNQIWPVG